jgi:hypothetical protein
MSRIQDYMKHIFYTSINHDAIALSESLYDSAHPILRPNCTKRERNLLLFSYICIYSFQQW